MHILNDRRGKLNGELVFPNGIVLGCPVFRVSFSAMNHYNRCNYFKYFHFDKLYKF